MLQRKDGSNRINFLSSNPCYQARNEAQIQKCCKGGGCNLQKKMSWKAIIIATGSEVSLAMGAICTAWKRAPSMLKRVYEARRVATKLYYPHIFVLV